MSVRENVARVVSRLGDLKQDMVLVGGASVHFLVPPSLAAEIRPTEDVDFVVDVESISDWVDFIPRLRKQNFAEYTENDPPLICRWIVDGILVDIIPTDPRFLGFSNRWYTSALAMADSVEVAPGLHCRIIDLASFVATKFEAFDSRGTNDYVADTDFEDIIISILGYREDATDLILASADPMRSYLVEQVAKLLMLPNLADLISHCFASDRRGQQWVTPVLGCLKRVETVARVRALLEKAGNPQPHDDHAGLLYDENGMPC